MNKRIVIFLLVSLCVISIISFILVPRKIKFDRWGQGFVHLSELIENKPFPPEALLITSVDDWNNYVNKYLIMIGPVSPNSLQEGKALLIISLPSAMDYKETTYGNYTIKTILKRNNEIIVYVDLNNEPAVNNSNEIKSLFYEPFLVNLKDVSKDTKIRIIKDK